MKRGRAALVKRAKIRRCRHAFMGRCYSSERFAMMHVIAVARGERDATNEPGTYGLFVRRMARAYVMTRDAMANNLFYG